MKIALLGTRGVPARYGGFETFAERLGIGLVEGGYEVTVFCERATDDAPSTYRGIQLRYVSVPHLGGLGTVVFDLKCLWRARKSFDVVYMLGYGAAPFCLIPLIWNSEVWINPDGIEWARSKWGFSAKQYFKLMEWFSVRIPHRLIADCEAIRARLTKRHGHLSNCTVIPYGCDSIDEPQDVRLLTDWNLASNDYYLIVCRLEPENHVLEVVRAFQRSRSRKQLVVVGNHFVGNSYVKTLCSIEDTRIRFIGPVYERERVTALRWHAYAYMHGHSVGGTNPSLLEAMGCGNLVFAHDNDFNRETLGTAGIYFDSIEDLTSKIEQAEEDEDELAGLKCAAKARARMHYGWDGIIKRYSELLCNSNAGNPRS